MALSDLIVKKRNGKLQVVDKRTNKVLSECDAEDKHERGEVWECPHCGALNYGGEECSECWGSPDVNYGAI